MAKNAKMDAKDIAAQFSEPGFIIILFWTRHKSLCRGLRWLLREVENSWFRKNCKG